MAIETIEVRRDIRMPLLSEWSVVRADAVAGGGKEAKKGDEVRHVHRS
jgi:hypothetical protein